MRLTACLLVAGLVLGGAACTADDETAEPAPTTTTTTAAPAPPTTGPATTDLSDGEHVAYITGIDVERRGLTIDVIQLKEDEDGHPEIVNDNARLRMLTVASDAAVTILAEQDSQVVNQLATFDALTDHVTAESTLRPSGFPHGPYSLQISDGQISGIDEIFLP